MAVRGEARRQVQQARRAKQQAIRSLPTRVVLDTTNGPVVLERVL